MSGSKEILKHLRAEELDPDGGPLIGWTCTYLPLEILEAGGLHPCRILPEPSSDGADAYLDPNFCPLVKTALGAALEGAYASLEGLVILNTCDGMRRLYDAWKHYCPPSFTFFLDLPRNITPRSLSYFRDTLENFKKTVEGHFHIRITRSDLVQALEESNEIRALFRRLLILKGRGDPPLSQGDILDVFFQGWRLPKRRFREALREMVDQLEKEPPRPSQGPKVVVTGSFLEGRAVIDLVEELGGDVAGSDLCTGGRLIQEVSPSSDPLAALSEAYLTRPPCARMQDMERRISFIMGEVQEKGARGVIFHALKFCDPYLYEAPALGEALRQIGIPFLFIEGDYRGRVSGGARTRVQAFLEMLEGYEP